LWRIALVPHALPSTDQGLCRAADQTRPLQARHHALPQALHRPRDLPPTSPARHLPLARNRRHRRTSPVRTRRSGTPACFASRFAGSLAERPLPHGQVPRPGVA
jgi:hypothetical protein